MIKVENITFQFPQGAAPIFKDFSARFERGEIVALAGKNGYGKTTLSMLLAGILRPGIGHIFIDDYDTSRYSLFEIGQKLGYVFQNPNRQLFCKTVYHEVIYGLRKQGQKKKQAAEKADQYLDYFGLTAYRNQYHGHLSLGEKQMLALAAVFALGTDYLVLDEPTIGLDMHQRHELGDMLFKLRQEQNCGIVLICQESAFTSRYSDRELVIPG